MDLQLKSFPLNPLECRKHWRMKSNAGNRWYYLMWTHATCICSFKPNLHVIQCWPAFTWQSCAKGVTYTWSKVLERSCKWWLSTKCVPGRHVLKKWLRECSLAQVCQKPGRKMSKMWLTECVLGKDRWLVSGKDKTYRMCPVPGRMCQTSDLQNMSLVRTWLTEYVPGRDMSNVWLTVTVAGNMRNVSNLQNVPDKDTIYRMCPWQGCVKHMAYRMCPWKGHNLHDNMFQAVICQKCDLQNVSLAGMCQRCDLGISSCFLHHSPSLLSSSSAHLLHHPPLVHGLLVCPCHLLLCKEQTQHTF